MQHQLRYPIYLIKFIFWTSLFREVKFSVLVLLCFVL